jgi:hypothetical protein
MTLIRERRILDYFKDKPNIKVVSIKTTSSIIETKFDGSVHKFFQTLKNSLHSINGLTNRVFFKNLSGTYFFLNNSDKIDLIMIYDTTTNNPNELQFRVRIKKLLGLKTEIKFGEYPEFSDKLKFIVSYDKGNELFGTFYKLQNEIFH